jgi:hypothetical protein
VVVIDPSSQTFHVKDVPHGEVRQLRYTSKVTQVWRRAFAYTTSEYDTAWPVQGRVDSILEDLDAAKKAVPKLIVMDEGYAVKPGEAPAQADSSELALPAVVAGNSPRQADEGVVGVGTSVRPSGSPTYPLDVLAALSAGRKKLAISAVNPTEGCAT